MTCAETGSRWNLPVPPSPLPRSASRTGGYAAGLMFWFTWKTLSGSY